jgi:uncharacterized SAM-binding protein YcdF (DUF218 family)
MQNIDQLAKVLWNYMVLGQPPRKADVILALGSYNPKVANRAAELYLQGYSRLIVMTGGRGRLTPANWPSEAEYFADVAIQLGVPKEHILLEPKSTNTEENILFSRSLLAKKLPHISSVLLVTKPYMERRAWATFKKRWPEVELTVTSPQTSYEDYISQDLSEELMINIMVGDVQRTKVYPGKGFMIEQQIPEKVWNACEQLIQLGFDKHLVDL